MAVITGINAKIDWLLRWILPFFLIGLFFWTLSIGYKFVVDEHIWTVGDWLINYQGGFVRRGLVGELFWHLGAVFSVHPRWFVLGAYSLCYGAYFAFSYLLLRNQISLIPYLFLIVSPVTFLFQIHDQQGGFRKEILFFAVLSMLAYAVQALSKQKFRIVFFTTLFLYPLVILSHEMLAVGLSYLLVIYILSAKISRFDAVLVGFGILVNLITFSLCLRFSGDTLTAALIGISLSFDGQPWLNGAVMALSIDTKSAFEATEATINELGYLSLYLLVGALTALAFLPVWRKIASIFKSPINAILILISFLGTFAVFFVAVDWGRFIYLHAVALFLLTLAPIDHKISKNTQSTLNSWRLTLTIPLILYANTWMLPHHGATAREKHADYRIFDLFFDKPFSENPSLTESTENE